MSGLEHFVIKFKGKQTCNTYEEAMEIKEQLGERYLRTYKCTYPDVEFFIVEFKED